MIQVPKTKFTDTKLKEVKWVNFAKGLNTLLPPQKIRDDELAVADNVLLYGDGNPGRRWGTDYYGNTSSGVDVRGLFAYYGSDGSSQLLKLEDGFLKKLNTGTGNWDVVAGASFTMSQTTRGTMANDSLYLINTIDGLIKYNGSSLVPFNLISPPSSNWATRGASIYSGQYLYSYRVTALNAVGETTAAAAATVAANLPRELWNTDPTALKDTYSISINWNVVTGASGYNIYGTTGGDETYIAHVDGQQVSSWKDMGYIIPSNVFVLPTGNSTAGPKGKFIMEFKTTLMIGGDPAVPSRVYYSAGIDKVDSFLINDGGGWVDVSKNTDDGVVSGLANFQNTAILFKERSIWQFDYNGTASPSMSNIRLGLGCVSNDTVKVVENDLFFMGRKSGGGAALYVLGNEPNFLNVLRTNEISTRLRPDLKTVLGGSFENMVAVYIEGKYIVFYQDGNDAYNKSAIVYDRERLGFTKWSEVNAIKTLLYYDSDKNEKVLLVDGADMRVKELTENAADDCGQAIQWNFKTKSVDFGDPFVYKRFKWVKFKAKNVNGSVYVKLWADNTLIYTKLLNLASSDVDTSFGAGQFAKLKFGATEDGNISPAADVVIRRLPVGRLGTVSISPSLALEFAYSDTQSKLTLLDVSLEYREKSKNYYPRTEVFT
jgi:hypothetical protein